MTQNLQDYAQQLVNISISDEEDLVNCSPIRQSNYQTVVTQGQPSAKKSIANSVKGQAKSTTSKTTKKQSGVKSTKDKTKEMKEQFEEQAKQLKWYQEEYQRLKDQKKQLKEEKTQYAILLLINNQVSLQNEKLDDFSIKSINCKQGETQLDKVVKGAINYLLKSFDSIINQQCTKKIAQFFKEEQWKKMIPRQIPEINTIDIKDQDYLNIVFTISTSELLAKIQNSQS
ncbi:unnamed protein product [Paramecium sonneborni]|uniref:Uncharacterized protein n=1 Tax=Paramecium sonneborni TaxID=65129 RepID=A0A8S1PMJ9_9CILI|nr:unnamed protein product [Paramecium sonneborni]